MADTAVDMEEGELSDDGSLEAAHAPAPRAAARAWPQAGLQVTFQTGARDLPDLVRSIDGQDLTLDRGLTERMEARAKRFNLSGWKSRVNFDLIQDLYESLGLPEDERDGKKTPETRVFRLEALHIHGVGQMKAEDIYEYFKEFNPIAYEWVDTQSANVVWALSSSSAQALLALSRPLAERPPPPEEDMEVNQRVVHEDGEEEGPGIRPPLTPAELEARCQASKDEPIYRDEVPGTVPEGRWRLGRPSPLAPTLFMRVATVQDSASVNPNLDHQLFQKNRQLRMEGGLLSASRKRKLHEVVQFDQERVAEEERMKKYNGPVGKNPWGSIAQDWSKGPKARDFADELQMFAKERGIGLGPKPRISQTIKDWDNPDAPVLPDEEGLVLTPDEEEEEAVWKKKLKRPRMCMVADEVEDTRRLARNRLYRGLTRQVSNHDNIEIFEAEEDDDEEEGEDDPLVPARDLRLTIKAKMDTEPDAEVESRSVRRLNERFPGGGATRSSIHKRLGGRRRSGDTLERYPGVDLRAPKAGMLIQFSPSDDDQGQDSSRRRKLPAIKIKEEKPDNSTKTVRRIASPVMDPVDNKKDVREQIRKQARERKERDKSSRDVARPKSLDNRHLIPSKKSYAASKVSAHQVKIKKEKTSDNDKKTKSRRKKKVEESSSSSEDDSSSDSSDSSDSDSSSGDSSSDSDSDSSSSGSSSSSDSTDSEEERAKKKKLKKKPAATTSEKSKPKLGLSTKRGISRRENVREKVKGTRGTPAASGATRKRTTSSTAPKKESERSRKEDRGSGKKSERKSSSAKDDSGLREKLKKYLKQAKEKRTSKK